MAIADILRQSRRRTSGVATGPVLMLILLAVLTVSPVLLLAYGGLRDAPIGAPGSFTLDNIRRLVFSPAWLIIVETALIAAAAVVGGFLAGGVGLAWLVGRTNLPGASFFEAVLTLPLYLPPIMMAVAWAMLGAPRVGLLNVMTKATLGFEVLNVYSHSGVIWYLMVFSVAFHLSFAASAFRTFDASLEEAGRVSGARPIRVLIRIVIPLLFPILSGVFLYSLVRSFEAFEGPLLLGAQAGVDMISTEIYDLVQNRLPPDYPLASVMGVSSVLIVLPLTWYQWQVLGRRSFAVLGGKGYKAGSYDLGVWRWPAVLLCVLETLVVVVLPISQLVLGSLTRFFGIFEAGFTLEHYASVLSNSQLLRALLNSAILGTIGAALALVLSGLIGYVIVRGRGVSGWVRVTLNFLSWLPLTVPGIVLALGFLWLYAFSPIPLYATRVGLVIAYVVLVLPLASRAMVGSLSQISADLEEAGRVAGGSWFRTVRTILIPLIWPSAMVAWILAFVGIFRDLSTSVLLVPPGQPVFSTALLELWSLGRIEQVCVLSVLAMLPMVVARYLVGYLQRYEMRMRSTTR